MKARFEYFDDMLEQVDKSIKNAYEKFYDCFLPATASEMGREMLLFLDWLDANNYKIIKKRK